MRVTYIVVTILVFVAGAADAASDQRPTMLHSENAKPSPTPDPEKVIFVYGFVRNQGAIQATKGLTLSKAIEMAGGFSDFANRRKVQVRRPKENRSFTVDVKAVLQKKADAQDPLLEAGDVVYVPTRPWE
jgi:hypothetical protein